MEFKYCFNEVANLIHKCTVKLKLRAKKERKWVETVRISKDSCWNLKQHIFRKHEDVLCKHGSKGITWHGHLRL